MLVLSFSLPFIVVFRDEEDRDDEIEGPEKFLQDIFACIRTIGRYHMFIDKFLSISSAHLLFATDSYQQNNSTKLFSRLCSKKEKYKQNLDYIF